MIKSRKSLNINLEKYLAISRKLDITFTIKAACDKFVATFWD